MLNLFLVCPQGRLDCSLSG